MDAELIFAMRRTMNDFKRRCGERYDERNLYPVLKRICRMMEEDEEKEDEEDEEDEEEEVEEEEKNDLPPVQEQVVQEQEQEQEQVVQEQEQEQVVNRMWPLARALMTSNMDVDLFYRMVSFPHGEWSLHSLEDGLAIQCCVHMRNRPSAYMLRHIFDFELDEDDVVTEDVVHTTLLNIIDFLKDLEFSVYYGCFVRKSYGQVMTFTNLLLSQAPNDFVAEHDQCCVCYALTVSKLGCKHTLCVCCEISMTITNPTKMTCPLCNVPYQLTDLRDGLIYGLGVQS